MKASDVLNQLIEMSGVRREPTVDTLKAGSDDKEVKKVAFCFTATPAIIKAAADWGADVLITHEPTYHDHFDHMHENVVTLAKKKLIDDGGMTIYRYHDHPHFASSGDMIHLGFLRKSGLKGIRTPDPDGRPISFFSMDDAMTATEVAKVLGDKLGLKYVRIIGAANVKMTKAVLCLGACGDIAADVLRDTDTELCIAGEISEWKNGCFVRDAAELGLHKAMILLGHCGSERDGMEYVRDMWNERYGNMAESKYFETPDLFV